MGSLVAMTGDCKSPLFGVRWFESTLAHITEMWCNLVTHVTLTHASAGSIPAISIMQKKWFLFEDIWDNITFTIRITVDALARKGSSLKSTLDYAKDSSYSITLLNM